MENINSILNMNDMYFSKILFKQTKEQIGEIQLKIEYNIDYHTNNYETNKYQVVITTTIKDEKEFFYLEVIANGIFQLESQDIEQSIYENLVKINTVAIMFPYIRSQVSIITSQPGLMPIQLPVLDVNKLVEINTKINKGK